MKQFLRENLPACQPSSAFQKASYLAVPLSILFVLSLSLVTDCRAESGIDSDWWSLRPLERSEPPKLKPLAAKWARTPIDQFILAKLREKGLNPSPEADRRTLIRRLYFDLIGLPPPPDRIAAFLNDKDQKAYEKLVDELLASKHYGERWARHWLDVVRYGDTHGYDKDKLRNNAWPYRDFVIRSFNDDKPYSRFIEEQLAGDVLYPGTKDGILGLGFIAAGPWDFIGHVEVPESKVDGKRSRNLDRDDMVSATMNTFTSMTAQCARCHNHKFDPVSTEDYYSLQAVFAAVDRADRPYDANPKAESHRRELQKEIKELKSKRKALKNRLIKLSGGNLAALDQSISDLNRQNRGGQGLEFGYHSHIERKPDVTKWVQVDLGESKAIDEIVYVPCYDPYNNIGAGFGFPVRFKIEISNGPKFKKGATTVADQTKADYPIPGVTPQQVTLGGKQARYIRMTATKLVFRRNDYIFALAELFVKDAAGNNLASGAKVTSLDSIQAPPRWRRQNLVDGNHYTYADPKFAAELAELQEQRKAIYEKVYTKEIQDEQASIETALNKAEKELKRLPAGRMVYAAATHFTPQGGHQPTKGKPRLIRVLQRGEVTKPGKSVSPGTVRIIEGVNPKFELAPNHKEGDRRAALAKWIIDKRNPLTWRSIVNRVWHYHFGRGIVSTPNDFGRMGHQPFHPELIDWLAVEFRDGGQRIKHLHKLILMSGVYRQSSVSNEISAGIDSDNVYLWRMNRRRLDAESIRDAVLEVSGKLDRKMYGPGFRDFVLELTAHSPHYEYQKHDPNDLSTHRRSIYRFLARSSQQPFMETLDCADPSQMVARRNETLTPLSALALLNNKFMTVMAGHFAERLKKANAALPGQIDHGFKLATGRSPSAEERKLLFAYAGKHDLANACRSILNLNEFVFVD